MREQMTNSEEAQKRHEATLKSVEGIVEESNVKLADVNLKSDDIVQALERNALTSEAQQRAMIAITCFLKSAAGGEGVDREQMLRMLDTSIVEMTATLPSHLLQGMFPCSLSLVQDAMIACFSSRNRFF
jgi:hypothetical protein